MPLSRGWFGVIQTLTEVKENLFFQLDISNINRKKSRKNFTFLYLSNDRQIFFKKV
jgi:hypothetical protein